MAVPPGRSPALRPLRPAVSSVPGGCRRPLSPGVGAWWILLPSSRRASVAAKRQAGPFPGAPAGACCARISACAARAGAQILRMQAVARNHRADDAERPSPRLAPRPRCGITGPQPRTHGGGAGHVLQAAPEHGSTPSP
ncbi:hypothetical protein FQR65_LT20554 [Abscondita terminalis]|nr:hypothetical protein FQR65_LT20554 [Abscondita terminalis]